MIIFLTGPSGAGKSALRDYYCQKRHIKPIVALTTRPARPGEIEIHKSVSAEYFQALRCKGELCLVSENHGAWYGYHITDIPQSSKRPQILEVDSRTAIRESTRYQATIVRVVPYSLTKASHIIIEQKHNGIDDRLRDLWEQVDKNFLSKRIEAGDLVFTNSYDAFSKEQFCQLLDSWVR